MVAKRPLSKGVPSAPASRRLPALLDGLFRKRRSAEYSAFGSRYLKDRFAYYRAVQSIFQNPFETFSMRKGQGHYVGTYLAWGVRNNGWWGEGEIKFFIDGDKDWPTICGTGTEDYFGGAWNFEFPKGQYGAFTSPYSGLAQVIKPDGLYASQQRFGLYRWHIADPI